jgi:hypothetical protein
MFLIPFLYKWFPSFLKTRLDEDFPKLKRIGEYLKRPSIYLNIIQRIICSGCSIHHQLISTLGQPKASLVLPNIEINPGSKKY